MKQNVKESLDNILNCMSGADGGIAFVRLMALLEKIGEDEAHAGRLVEEAVHQFSRLINVANAGDPTKNVSS